MRAKLSILLAALLAVLPLSLAVQAAEENAAAATKPAAEAKPAEGKQVVTRKKPVHEHTSFHKGLPETQTAATESGPGKPAHDHQKFHK